MLCSITQHVRIGDCQNMSKKKQNQFLLIIVKSKRTAKRLNNMNEKTLEPDGKKILGDC